MSLTAAGGLFPAAGAADPPRASLQDFRCRRASTPSDRMVGVTAVMRPVSGTGWMQLRFQLLERPAGSRRLHQLRGGDLGRWLHPNPPSFGREPQDVWMVNKPVLNLAAPAVYRFRVTFRWLDRSSNVIDLETAGSSPCKQPR